MNVRVIGRYKSIAGGDRVELEVADEVTVRGLIEALVKKYPALEKDKRFMMVSRNKTYTSPDTVLKKDDDITISPPVVSGG